jgi:hypothetical protein
MEDGWDQESQTIRRLAEAGIKIINRQQKVEIGRSKIPGTIDGMVEMGGILKLWEHKAWNERAFYEFAARGLKNHLGEKAQINGYMLGAGLDSCIFMVKHKDSNDYADIEEKLDKEFIGQIVDWCDEIRLGGWAPEPEERPECSYCGVGCFGTVLDFSWIGEATATEMVEKWKKGKLFTDMGEMLMDEARAYFVGKTDKYGNELVKGIIGNKELLVLEGLEIKKITRHWLEVSKAKILEEFGPDGLMRVSEDRESSYYRFREVS